MLVPNNKNAPTHKVWVHKTNVRSTIVCPLWAQYGLGKCALKGVPLLLCYLGAFVHSRNGAHYPYQEPAKPTTLPSSPLPLSTQPPSCFFLA